MKKRDGFKTGTNTKKKKAQKRGRYAEAATTWFLRLKGYKILERNYRTKVGEIDIIARKNDTICFIEVKKRVSKQEAATAISPNQQARIIRAAEHYLSRHSHYQILDQRFDAVLIGATVIPYHLENAWQVS